VAEYGGPVRNVTYSHTVTESEAQKPLGVGGFRFKSN
jgi:hypothetical protein